MAGTGKAGEESSFVVALIENRAKEVGLAACDLRSASLHLSQFVETSRSYQSTKTSMAYFAPHTIILCSNNMAPDDMIGVAALAQLPPFSTAVKKGALAVQEAASDDNYRLNLSYKQHYLALSAAHAVLKWVETEMGVSIQRRSLEVTFNESRNHMGIDATSLQNLEVVESRVPKIGGQFNRKGSLFDKLNTTKTIGGTRLLKANLLQPLNDPETITKRLDCLALSEAQSELFTNLASTVCLHPGFQALRESIREKIPMTEGHRSKQAFVTRTQICFAVKDGVDGFLDMARKTFNDTSDAIQQLTANYIEKFGLASLRVLYKAQKGFHFAVSEKEVEEKGLPGIFVQVTKNGADMFCTSEELISLNRRNKEAARECISRSNRVVEGISQQIRQEIRLLFVLSECLSLLDVLVNSFAALVSTCEQGTYVRPEFTDDGPIAIEGGRHLILETLMPDSLVPNNTFLSEASNMLVVMGPNMSGKSTYLRQVALLTILAHIGCYVPAQFASFRITDHIFTRMGVSDDIESNSGTFMTEMHEMAFISHNLTPRSLVLIDELGKSTSTADGFAIAWACTEELLSTNAYTINATHEHRLAEMPIMYPNVKVSHFSVDVANGRLDFKYVLKEGYLEVPNYGILLAKAAGFPDEVIADAQRIAAAMEKKAIKRLDFGLAKYKAIRRDYQLAQKLLCLEYSTLSTADLEDYLQDLKDRYLDGKSL